jgi:hypothetical protein
MRLRRPLCFLLPVSLFCLLRPYHQTHLIPLPVSSPFPPGPAPSPSRLPSEIVREIFLKLSHSDIAQAAAVCKKWKAMAEDPQLWRTLCRTRWESKVGGGITGRINRSQIGSTTKASHALMATSLSRSQVYVPDEAQDLLLDSKPREAYKVTP